eukprot:610099-Hanusia_phi.AAC.2
MLEGLSEGADEDDGADELLEGGGVDEIRCVRLDAILEETELIHDDEDDIALLLLRIPDPKPLHLLLPLLQDGVHLLPGVECLGKVCPLQQSVPATEADKSRPDLVQPPLVDSLHHNHLVPVLTGLVVRKPLVEGLRQQRIPDLALHLKDRSHVLIVRDEFEPLSDHSQEQVGRQGGPDQNEHNEDGEGHVGAAIHGRVHDLCPAVQREDLKHLERGRERIIEVHRVSHGVQHSPHRQALLPLPTQVRPLRDRSGRRFAQVARANFCFHHAASVKVEAPALQPALEETNVEDPDVDAHDQADCQGDGERLPSLSEDDQSQPHGLEPGDGPENSCQPGNDTGRHKHLKGRRILKDLEYAVM